MAFLLSDVPILCGFAFGLTLKTDKTSLVLMNFYSKGKGLKSECISGYSTAIKRDIGEETEN